jgi:hypothetical protein
MKLAAVANKKTLLDIYNLAVNDQPYSFLYVNLRAKSPNDMFYIRFEKKTINLNNII